MTADRYPHGHSRWKVQERDARIANGFERVSGSLSRATITIDPPAPGPGWNNGLLAEAFSAGRRAPRR